MQPPAAPASGLAGIAPAPDVGYVRRSGVRMATPFLPALISLVLLQAPSASVQGTVRDVESGAALAGAIVDVPDLGRSTAAGRDGHYRLPDLPAGPHHVTVRFLGYASHTVSALVPREGALEINF